MIQCPHCFIEVLKHCGTNWNGDGGMLYAVMLEIDRF